MGAAFVGELVGPLALERSRPTGHGFHPQEGLGPRWTAHCCRLWPGRPEWKESFTEWLRLRQKKLPMASDKNCSPNQPQADGGIAAATLALRVRGSDKAISSRVSASEKGPCRPAAPYTSGPSTTPKELIKTTRHTREKTAIIKGVNDSFALGYWGFVMSLITHFNKHISPRADAPRVRTGPPSTPCYFLIRRRFMKPPTTDAHQPTARLAGLLLCALGGRLCALRSVCPPCVPGSLCLDPTFPEPPVCEGVRLRADLRWKSGICPLNHMTPNEPRPGSWASAPPGARASHLCGQLTFNLFQQQDSVCPQTTKSCKNKIRTEMKLTCSSSLSTQPHPRRS